LCSIQRLLGLGLLAFAIFGCDALVGLSSSLGGGVAGRRGTVRVVFINNTPHQVAFTYGMYDPADVETQPDFGQFVLDDSGATLAGDGVSDVVTLTCARRLSLGSPILLERIDRNLPDAPRNEESFVTGVQFFADGSADSSPLAGEAPAFEAQLGVDFPCEALLIIRFEFDDLSVGSFRTDFELIPSVSTR
jgi:hypothetical protein